MENNLNKLKKIRSSIHIKSSNRDADKPILKFSTGQFKQHRSTGHAIRDLISSGGDYLAPIFKLIFPNFIAVHYAYIIFATLLCSLMMLPITKESNGKYIDTLLLSAAATSQGGLNTVNLNTLTIWQQFCLFMTCFLTTPIFIHSALAFVRLYWFERYFDGIRDWSKRNFKTRRTRTLVQRNMLTGNTQTMTAFGKSPILSKTLSRRRTDRLMTNYISPDVRTKSRTSMGSNARTRTNRNDKGSRTHTRLTIDYAKPPKKTEVTFGEPDINIQKRQQKQNGDNGVSELKPSFNIDNNSQNYNAEKSLAIDPLSSSSDLVKESDNPVGEDFQSRLFRGEAIYRDEDDAIDDEIDTANNHVRKFQGLSAVDDGADEMPIDREEDLDERSPIDDEPGLLNQQKSSNTTDLENVSDAKKSEAEEPQLHFDLPNKQQKASNKTSIGNKQNSGKRGSLYKVISAGGTDLKNKLQNLKNRGANNDYEMANLSNPEDGPKMEDFINTDNYTAEELEALIHDPKFQDQIYKSWKKQNTANASSGIRPNLKTIGRAHTFLSLSRINTGNVKTNTRSQAPELKHRESMTSKGSELSQVIPHANEDFVDDGMDWENGKVGKTVGGPVGPIHENHTTHHMSETDSFDSEELSHDGDSYNTEDYNDDDIDLDYDYNKDESDNSHFEIVPTNNVKIGRNSKFVGLTDKQKEELGGVEYRALKLLCKYLSAYYFGFTALAMLLHTAWICGKKSKPLDSYHGNSWAIKSAQEDLKSFDVNKIWWGIFTSASTFNDMGLALTPNSMISFCKSTYILIWGIFFIIIGNTGFPIFLRFIIWIGSKASQPLSQRRESLQFLLDHPRRCFTLLFPSGPTWWLFFILIVLNVFDWAMFIILDYNSTNLKTALGEGWFRVLNGLYQSVSTRTAGFATTNISLLSPAVQVSYMLMMYVSVMPLAISIRRTNVYEEQSLGIFHDSSKLKRELKNPQTGRTATKKDEEESLVGNNGVDETTIENHAPSFIGTHLRRQLSFDLWFLFLGLFIICICESKRIQDVNDPSFTIWTILFEIVSAYGTVGLSLGYPNTDTSFCAQFTTLSKFIVVLLLLRGKHRGLPNSLDRAIMLPSDHLQQLDNKNFKLVNDNGDEEEEYEEIEEYRGSASEPHNQYDEEDLGGDNSLSKTRSRMQSVVERDPVLNYFNKRKDQAKHFVQETKNAVLHHE